MGTTTKLTALIEKNLEETIKSVKNNAKDAKDSAPAPKKDKATKTTKKDKVVKEVTDQQEVALVEKVTSNREVKWLYPADCQDPLSKKAWRGKARTKLHKLEMAAFRIKDQNSKEFKAAFKEYEDYKATVLKPGQTA